MKMSRVAEKEVFKFNELSDEVQAEVIEKNWNWNVEHFEWFEFVFEDVKEIGKLIGIDIKDIYFSGFASQGDGACFKGDYEYKKESVKNIKAYAPLDTELHEIVQNLYLEQKKHFYQLSATIEHSGHYSHSGCTIINVYKIELADGCDGSVLNETIEQLLREFMQWIYTRLESEYDYLTSEEAIRESIEANGMEFEIDGTIY